MRSCCALLWCAEPRHALCVVPFRSSSGVDRLLPSCRSGAMFVVDARILTHVCHCLSVVEDRLDACRDKPAAIPSTVPDRQSTAGSHTQTLAALALSAAVTLNRRAACTSAAAGRWTWLPQRSCHARIRRTAPCRWALTPRAPPAKQYCSSLMHHSLVGRGQGRGQKMEVKQARAFTATRRFL